MNKPTRVWVIHLILTFLFESSDGENYGHTDADYSIKINGIRPLVLGVMMI